MENKLPFYMAYPVPLLYNDRMEYDGSMMYDEYPDRLQLRLMCRRIYDKAEKEEENPGAWLMDLIEVMTYQELCRRRVEHREIRKKIY